MTETCIHETAIVAKTAKLGVGVEVGPYSIVGPNVEIGDHTWVDSHVVIDGFTTIGVQNKIWRFASIGTLPQDLKYKGEEARLEVGDQNLIREYVNVSIGTEHGGMLTKVGSKNLFMVNVHVGHDCVVGDNSIFANGVSLAGHVELGNHVFMAGHSAIHQFCQMGSYSMAAAGSIVTQDVPPFVMVEGNRASPHGLNSILMKRQGFSSEEMNIAKKVYKYLYRKQLTLEDALLSISDLGKNEITEMFHQFFERSSRGICR